MVRTPATILRFGTLVAAGAAAVLACCLVIADMPGEAADQHWSLQVPVCSPLPRVRAADWPRNPIDYFVLERLELDGLTPSRDTDKTTWIRRVTLDLTGLPPSVAEVDAFLEDESPEAFERVVDRLLASPRYGERMTVPWLYAARYADTSGYQNDGPRHMWRWRDWVIDAFNQNMPFDQFTIEQIAGDMLDGATLEQRIATGFNRNHRGNAEGGIIPEEYAVEYVVDRVDTTATVFLGLTVGCARCHNHKYDPISQREFYGLFAYFNNIPEFGRAIKEGNSPPYIQAPRPHDRLQLARIDRDVSHAEAEFGRLRPRLDAAQAEWERARGRGAPADWSISDGLIARFDFNDSARNTCDASGEVHVRDGAAAWCDGVLARASEFDGKRFIDAGDTAALGYLDKFTIAAWVRSADTSGGVVVSRMADAPEADGYYVQLADGRVQVNLVKRWLDDAIRVETERRLEPRQWHHLTVTYDGSRAARGIQVYVDGIVEPMRVHLDFINQTFATKEPLRIGGGGGPAGRFRGAIDELRIYHRSLERDEVEILALRDTIDTIAAIEPARRTPPQAAKLAAYFLDQHAPPPWREGWHQLVALRRQRQEFIENLPTVMVMQEMPERRQSYLLLRGEYDKRAEPVEPGVPACLPPLPSGTANDRLGLARWLVDPSNPLTARVTVNRIWQLYFGIGLVRTSEDFGVQGEPPSHPDLLDWLAVEFVRSGWDVKALHKLIVLSATYRQSSKATPELVARDPENRLLARGPRLRLPAETIRDAALCASGLLVEQLGGPSVKPYQPPGLWKDVATDSDYVQDHGKNLYRRSLYTYWKRTVAPPAMVTLDATARETCTVRETRTNTPLQALTLMNDVTFVEAARVLAQRVMAECDGGPPDRIALAFRLLLARAPAADEARILAAGFHDQLERYRRDRASAARLAGTGEFPSDPSLDVAELAAYTAVANLIMNLDEVLVKE